MNLSAPDHLLAGAVALGAGFVNAIAGGGTVLTFPALVALGVPAVGANITNTVALCPGYFGGTFAQADALREQRRRLAPIAAVAAAGGLAGSVLLVSTSERVFEALIPWLLLAACALLGFQGSIRRLLPAARAAGSGR
ncbi:MAG: TSUP family transporter, partial [Acidimicrobiales bacterium]